MDGFALALPYLFQRERPSWKDWLRKTRRIQILLFAILLKPIPT